VTTLAEILQRIIDDADFRDSFRSDPEAALKSTDLSEADRQALLRGQMDEASVAPPKPLVEQYGALMGDTCPQRSR